MFERRLPILFIATLASASAALACPPGSEESDSPASQTLTRFMQVSGTPGAVRVRAVANNDAGGSRNSETSSVVSVTDGDTRVEIVSKTTISTDENGNETREENGETKVTVAGKEIPQNRFQRQGDLLRILDENGAVMRTVQLPEMHTSTLGAHGGVTHSAGSASGSSSGAMARALSQARSRGGSSLGSVAVPGFAIGSAASPADAPKVMLGVVMEQPDESLAEHLKVNPDDVTVIGSVSADTPAAKAGLQKSDVIIAIDGQSPAPQAKIREVLRGKEPGQTATLTVISGGRKRDVTVTLEPFDASKLGVRTGVWMGDSDNSFGGAAGDPAQLKQLLEQLHLDGQFDIDIADGPDVLFAPSGPTGAAPPAAGGQPVPGVYRFRMQHPDGSGDDRLRELEDRLRAMTEMMQRLEERLAAQHGGAAPQPNAKQPAPPPPPPSSTRPRA